MRYWAIVMLTVCAVAVSTAEDSDSKGGSERSRSRGFRMMGRRGGGFMEQMKNKYPEEYAEIEKLRESECKVQYDKTQENGLIKSTKEAYLVDALSFTEAEETITKEMEPFMSGEFVVSDIKRARIAELFENEDLNADRWYRVKVGFISFDEKSEKEKVITQTDLVQATDLKNAIETLEKGMQGTLGDYKIISVTETPLIDVFRHKVEE